MKYLVICILFLNFSCTAYKEKCHQSFKNNFKKAALTISNKYECDSKLILKDLKSIESRLCGKQIKDRGAACMVASTIISKIISHSTNARWKCNKSLVEKDLKFVTSTLCKFI